MPARPAAAQSRENQGSVLLARPVALMNAKRCPDRRTAVQLMARPPSCWDLAVSTPPRRPLVAEAPAEPGTRKPARGARDSEATSRERTLLQRAAVTQVTASPGELRVTARHLTAA